MAKYYSPPDKSSWTVVITNNTVIEVQNKQQVVTKLKGQETPRVINQNHIDNAVIEVQNKQVVTKDKKLQE